MGRHHGIEGFREFSNLRGIFVRGEGDLIEAFAPPYGPTAQAVVGAALSRPAISPIAVLPIRQRRPPPNSSSRSRKTLKTSRKMLAAIATAASAPARRRRLKSKIVNAPKIPSPATA